MKLSNIADVMFECGQSRRASVSQAMVMVSYQLLLRNVVWFCLQFVVEVEEVFEFYGLLETCCGKSQCAW